MQINAQKIIPFLMNKNPQTFIIQPLQFQNIGRIDFIQFNYLQIPKSYHQIPNQITFEIYFNYGDTQFIYHYYINKGQSIIENIQDSLYSQTQIQQQLNNDIQINFDFLIDQQTKVFSIVSLQQINFEITNISDEDIFNIIFGNLQFDGMYSYIGQNICNIFNDLIYLQSNIYSEYEFLQYQLFNLNQTIPYYYYQFSYTNILENIKPIQNIHTFNVQFCFQDTQQLINFNNQNIYFTINFLQVSYIVDQLNTLIELTKTKITNKDKIIQQKEEEQRQQDLKKKLQQINFED